MPEFTETKWVAGWGIGVTGPTCPSDYPTVGEYCDHKREFKLVTTPDEFHNGRLEAHTVIAIVPLRSTEAEQDANVALIAAAPDLYNALTELREWSRSVGTSDDQEQNEIDDEMFSRVDAALTKANGDVA